MTAATHQLKTRKKQHRRRKIAYTCNKTVSLPDIVSHTQHFKPTLTRCKSTTQLPFYLPSTELSESQRLRVLTWNILAPPFVSCADYNLSCDIFNIETRRPIIHKHLLTIDADVCLLQEVSRPEFNHLRNNTTIGQKYECLFVPHRINHWASGNYMNKQRNGNAILLSKSKFLILQSCNVRLSDNGNIAPLVWALYRPYHLEMMISSFHLDDLRKDLRLKQLRTLVQAMTDKSGGSTTMPLLLGGDTNEETQFLHKHMRHLGFHKSASKPTYFEERTMSIDFIYSRGLEPTKTEVEKSSQQDIVRTFGSDHMPVICTF